MESITAKVVPGKKISIDFSVVPAGIFLLEASSFLTEFLKSHVAELWKLVLARTVHFIFLLILTYLTNKLFKLKQISQLYFNKIILLGLLLSGLSLTAYHVVFDLLKIPTFTVPHTMIVVILHGAFWFPVLMVIGGSRTEIINAFNGYEERLLIQTRKSFKKSADFQAKQGQIEDEIRSELISQSNQINHLISKIDISQELTEVNNNIQKILSGKALRTLSLKLGNSVNDNSQSTILGQNLHSLLMVSKQFRILYRSTAKSAPLIPAIYVGLLVALTLPAYINFFTVVEILKSLPLLAFLAFILARFNVKVLKSDSENAILKSSLLILLIGYLPFILNQFGQQVNTNPNTSFPIFITGITFPFGYQFLIRFLQIIQPKAISLMQGDQLEASNSLRTAINSIVTEELIQTTSHRWAVYIHGKVLTKLAATSLKLEQSMLANDRDVFFTTLSNIQKLLENPAANFDETPLTLENEIKTRLNPWEGLLNISVHIDPSLISIQNERIRNLGEAVEEIISNSIRHGGAQTITLKITPINQIEIQVLVEDDAVNRPSTHPVRVGLGTKIFNLVSDGRWTHSYNNLSSQFKMIVAIAE